MKYVLITGATVNTGVAIVEKFASEGIGVVFTGRSAERVSEAERRYRSAFANVPILGYAIDSLTEDGLPDEEAVRKMFRFLDEHKIRIKTLVLNAADQGLGQTFFETPLREIMKVINTNVLWNYCLCREAAERMKEDGEGSIVFINSNTAYRAIPDRVSYVTSKGGQLGLMRALTVDLGQYGIRVNAILPGMIRTDRWEKNPDFYRTVPSRYTPIGDVANGRDIADAVWYFAEHARNTTGAELVVDGGNTVQLYPIVP